jgi:anti-sigma B factor antagonist
MAFQFKRDKNETIYLTIAGDIDLEVTPDIKSQLVGKLVGARGLTIDAANVSYLDSSGVSILIIAMQSCKQMGIALTIAKISDEAVRVLQLAKLDKILPIEAITGPSQLVGVDVFSPASGSDTQIADAVAQGAMGQASSDADLIAELSKTNTPRPAPALEPEPEPKAEPRPEPKPEPVASPTPAAAPIASPEPAPSEPKSPSASDTGDAGDGGREGGGGSFTPGTF